MRAIDGSELMLEIQACRWDSDQDRERAEDLVLGMPTLTPPNEPEYREYTCPNCHHTWLEDRDASDYPEYCPGCGDPLHKEENEPLTLEQLRESPHGKIKDSTLESICNRANEIASRPPEGEEES